MRDAEDAVGKVMAGLRGVEAASGLEGRVAAGARRRLAQRAPARGRFGAAGFGWGVVGFACLAVLLAVTMRAPRVPGRVVTGGATGIEGRGAGDGGRPREDVASGRSEGVSARGGRVVGGMVEGLPRRHAISIASSKGRRKAGDVAVSFPAPPLPLTEQERLLLRVATLSGPKEVAALDRFGRASQDAEETAVFETFFGRPETMEQTMQRMNKGESR